MDSKSDYRACVDLGTDCCGCELCIEVCPRGVFSAARDSVGFFYPKAEAEKCISCGLCSRKCPVINSKNLAESTHNIGVFAGWSTDEDTLMKSSSGGLFSALAKAVFAENGKVAGAVYSEGFKAVEFFIADNYSGIEAMRGSKYVQGRKSDIYRRVKTELKNCPVLFCGTPCEVAALVSYLGGAPENLYTCDFLCYGPTTEAALSQTVEHLERKYRSNVAALTMRNKRFGWTPKYIFKCVFSNGKSYENFFGNMPIGTAFTSLKRPSCHSCKFKDNMRASDITMADYWDIIGNSEAVEYNKNGTSLVIVNTLKGKQLFEKIEDFYSFSTEQLFAQKKPKALVSCAPVSPSRGPFEGKFVKMGLIEAVKSSKSVKSKLMEHVPLPIKYYGLKLLAKVRSFRDRG